MSNLCTAYIGNGYATSITTTIPVVLPYKQFELVLLMKGVPTNPSSQLSSIQVRDMRNKTSGFEVITDLVFEDEVRASREHPKSAVITATAENIQKAISWIDQIVLLDSLIPGDLAVKLSVDENEPYKETP